MSRSRYGSRSWAVAAVVVALFMLCLLFFGYCFGCSYPSLLAAKVLYTASLQRVDPVIDALELYHHDHGCYPPALCALTPRYLADLPELPPPFVGSYSAPRTPGGTGYTYDTRAGSYELYAFLSRPGDHGGLFASWTETLTYYGPGYPPGSSRGASIGHVGRWEYYGFID